MGTNDLGLSLMRVNFKVNKRNMQRNEQILKCKYPISASGLLKLNEPLQFY